ncbi:type 4 prepilin-like protein leader peptide-processing enzyme [Asticcacaulis biprosthecium C19]|uniref:Type 4 prepilin-like protein leader peptide-processing enzyme n=1 Tax=Asticcacaulis biprosthecium C19 TaxID=715226 RepID=F4QHZ6_9CAUL|nr:A24 family peptidase [Asticcacaulis biprosthecium]EGF92863.1 type 4 prepilin-like protein leader peptide-processing enzyme [Asticcacaulis biprosthecium C19]
MMDAEIAALLMRAAFGGAAGAVVGSFAATAALRLAADRSPLSGRSACDGCARTLSWGETVPFVGYAVARGRCSGCGHRIAPFHLAGEALGAVALAVPWVVLGGVDGLITGLLCLLLLIAALIDLKTLRLPDILTTGIAACALVLAFLSGHVVSGLIAAAVAAAVLYGVKYVLERRHGAAMLGLGDVKLVAALALWLNVRTPVMVAVAAVIGLVVIRNRKGLMPFGPMIAAAAFVIGILIPESWLV